MVSLEKKILKVRNEHNTIIQNDEYWDILYTAIALNVDVTINKLPNQDENGDIETYETKNKTDQGFLW